jgi:hypothetical protein
VTVKQADLAECSSWEHHETTSAVLAMTLAAGGRENYANATTKMHVSPFDSMPYSKLAHRSMPCATRLPPAMALGFTDDPWSIS